MKQTGDDALKQLSKAFKSGKATKGPSHADLLIEIGRTAGLFHLPDGDAYADVMVDGHRETWRVRNKGFRSWLQHQFFSKHKKACSSDAMQAAIETLAAIAHFEKEEREVHLRVAGHEGRIYIDVGDEAWQAIEVTRKGWKVIDKDVPVRFRRTPGMRALPIPVKGGKIDTLHKFLNVDDTDFKLVVAFMLAAMRPDVEYPILGLFGVQGSGKTTLEEILQRLIDPHNPPTRKAPRDEDELIVAANASHLLSLDNTSHMPEWLSDALCRLCTGAGSGKRKLYTDDEQVLFYGKRPIIINGIEDIITRGDAVTRSILMSLGEPENRRPEKELWDELDKAAPKILGALLDGLVSGLKLVGKVKIEKKPRMADLALWCEACCRAYWKAGDFIKAYRVKLDDTTELILEANIPAMNCASSCTPRRSSRAHQRSCTMF
jgi:hypothetical protein